MPQLQYEIAHRKSTMDESIEIFTDSSTGSFFKYFLFTIISVELDSKIRNLFKLLCYRGLRREIQPDNSPRAENYQADTRIYTNQR